MTPGSLRGVGATQFFVLTEDLVRLELRARWRRLETLQIYVQEVSPVEFLMKLPEKSRLRLQSLAAAWPRCLSLALELLQRRVPTSSWFAAFRTTTTG